MPLTFSDLNDDQKRAVEKLQYWFRYRTQQQQVFTVHGFAGTGKTSMVRVALESIDVPIAEAGEAGGAVFAAYTGRAAKNITKRNGGIPATTLHQLLYAPQAASIEELAACEAEIKGVEAALANAAGSERIELQCVLQRLQRRLIKLSEPQWVKKEGGAVADAALIVVDECSMADMRITDDVRALGKPIIVLGDPGQLAPPSNQRGGFETDRPDVFLTRIERQAEDNSLVRLSLAIREGQPLRCMNQIAQDGSGVWIGPQEQMSADYLLRNTDQVLCFMRVTREVWNARMKRSAGILHPYPIGHPGERVTCTKNDHDIGIMNGETVQFSHVRPHGTSDRLFHALVHGEFEGSPIPDPVEVVGYNGLFVDDPEFNWDKQRVLQQRLASAAEQRLRRGSFEACWAWTITTHKAQGSEWPSVALIDDGMGRNNAALRQRLLYTAITRASHRIVIFC